MKLEQKVVHSIDMPKRKKNETTEQYHPPCRSASGGFGTEWQCRSCGKDGNWDSRSSCRRCGISRNFIPKAPKVPAPQVSRAQQPVGNYVAAAKRATTMDASLKSAKGGGPGTDALLQPCQSRGVPGSSEKVQATREQLASVDSLIAAGDELLKQALLPQRARLVELLEQERKEALAAKPLSQRRIELDGSLQEVRAKLSKNQALAEAARRELEKLQGFVKSQQEREQRLNQELREVVLREASLLSAPPVDDIARLEALLVQTQQQLAVARSNTAAKDSGAVSPLADPTALYAHILGARLYEQTLGSDTSDAAFNVLGLGAGSNEEPDETPDTRQTRTQAASPY